MRIFTFSTRFVLLSVLLAAMVAHALIVGVFGVEALSPTTRQNPLDVVATCAGDEYATLTNEGIVCAKPTPACDTIIGRCVQCTQDIHCSGATFCDKTAQKKLA